MIHIYIKEKNGKFNGKCTQYPDIKADKDSYDACRDYMVNTIIKRQNFDLKDTEKKKEKKRIGFVA